jgi:hypothetical protein
MTKTLLSSQDWRRLTGADTGVRSGRRFLPQQRAVRLRQGSSGAERAHDRGSLGAICGVATRAEGVYVADVSLSMHWCTE